MECQQIGQQCVIYNDRKISNFITLSLKAKSNCKDILRLLDEYWDLMDLRKLNEWPHLLCRAIEFLTLLVFLVEKWLVSRFSGSKEADLHFSLGSFSGHYLVSSDDQSAWSIYTKYSLDDVVFVLWGRFNLFIAAWIGQWDFFLFFPWQLGWIAIGTVRWW